MNLMLMTVTKIKTYYLSLSVYLLQIQQYLISLLRHSEFSMVGNRKDENF